MAASCVSNKLAGVDIRARVLRFYLIGFWKWRFWKRHGTDNDSVSLLHQKIESKIETKKYFLTPLDYNEQIQTRYRYVNLLDSCK